MKKDLPEPEVIAFESPGAFDAWLDKSHGLEQGIWLRFYKKATGIPSITYDEAVDVALCHGWIDGQKKGYDAESYMLRFTPRRPRSIWSKVNVAKVEALTAAGKMREAGLAAVAAAKADGRWERAYASQSTIEIPEDLRTALALSPTAAENFEKMTKANRYAFLFRIHTAKRPETRAKHVLKTIEMLESGDTYH